MHAFELRPDAQENLARIDGALGAVQQDKNIPSTDSLTSHVDGNASANEVLKHLVLPSGYFALEAKVEQTATNLRALQRAFMDGCESVDTSIEFWKRKWLGRTDP
jgi:hypothetical protein